MTECTLNALAFLFIVSPDLRFSYIKAHQECKGVDTFCHLFSFLHLCALCWIFTPTTTSVFQSFTKTILELFLRIWLVSFSIWRSKNVTMASLNWQTLWDMLGGWKILIKAWTRTKITVYQQQTDPKAGACLTIRLLWP